MTCDTHLTLQAHAIAMRLTDRERIAFAVALIDTVLRPSRAADVMLAAKHINEHGEALLDADFAGIGALDALITSSGGSDTGTTHGTIEQMVPSESPGRSLSSSLGAAWAWIGETSDAVDDSWLGASIGGICMALIGVALLFAPLIWN